MTKTPTYKEQFDKITEAYIRGEIIPGQREFCFCGTLCDNNKSWFKSFVNRNHNDFGIYSGSDFVKMERALISHSGLFWMQGDDENKLFEGMCAALEVLKEIHQSKGEVIDETPPFVKRNLQPTHA